VSILAIGLCPFVYSKFRETTDWAEKDPKAVTIASAPLHVGPKLRDELFGMEGGLACILASATLSVGKPPKFDHVRAGLGLDEVEREALAVGSPFDYRRQVTLYLPRGLPDPSKEREEYDRAAILAIPRYLEMSKGRAFVLFTSIRHMAAAAHELRVGITGKGWTLLVQGEAESREKMIERFKLGDAVLFGVDSFWQGVDVPGDALSNVVIVRLPFRPPGDPLHDAREEDIRSKGGNPFFDKQVPETAIKLKQGFGRLIRTKTDRGMVVILDHRVTTKFYGTVLLNSLPECRRVIEKRPSFEKGGRS
jgi:ATP-dependent DNA helicase DinG